MQQDTFRVVQKAEFRTIMLLFLQKPARTDEMAKPGISGLKAIHRQILVYA
jgi:hypothetical protein